MNEKQPKIKVLIAEDRQVFRFGLQKAIEQSPAISIVGIVNNGREVLERVEELLPDIVILDSVMPVLDGLATAEQLVQAYPHIKIIFVSVSVEYERVASALEVGASAYLKKDSLELDLIPAILAVNRNNVYFSPEIIPIIQESRYSVFNLDEREQSWFETWEFFLAKEIILKWRRGAKIDTTVKETLESLAISKLELKLIEIPNAIKIGGQINTLLAKLKRVVVETEREYLRRNACSSVLLEQAKQTIEKWFVEEILQHIASKSQKLRISKVNELNALLSPYWQQASPEPLLDFLNELLKLLLALRQRYEQRRINNLTEIDNAWRAFANLKNLVDERDSLIERKELFEGAFRAIALGFECQLKVQVYEAISQILVNLIGTNQFYCDSAIKTNSLLHEVETSLLKEIEPTLTIFDSKVEIEIWIGHHLNQWGSSLSVSPNVVRERLLAKINLAGLDLENQTLQEQTELNYQRNL